MIAEQLVAELAAAGVSLYVDGERLRYRARSGAYSDEMRQRVGEQRAALLALLAPPPNDGLEAEPVGYAFPPFDPATGAPPVHWRAVASADPVAGLVGLLGPVITGELLGAAQRWESANSTDRDEATRAYAAVWARAEDLKCKEKKTR